MNPSGRLPSVAFLWISLLFATTASAALGERAGVTGSLALELNGSPVGYIRSAGGGDVRADVITDAMGAFPKKHLGAAKVADLRLELGPDMDKAVYDWVAASWSGKYSRSSGALLSVNFDSNVMARREFSNASLVETSIPDLDASSKDAGYVTVTLRPEMVRLSKGAGMVSPSLGGRARPWMVSNFRVEIPGLDCSKVKKVAGFTVKTDPDRAIVFPNIVLTFPESSADSWIEWHKYFVVDGLNGDGSEKNGAIVFLAGDMGTEIGRVALSNIGISSLRFDNPEGASNMIRTVTAELYCESMSFTWTGGSGGNVLNTRILIR